MISAPDMPSISAWWILVSIADVAGLEPVDQVELPQRVGAVERARRDARDLLGELVVGAGRRERDLADVEVQVEVDVVDPVGVVEAERDLGEAPAQRRELGSRSVSSASMSARVELPVGVVEGSRIARPATWPDWRRFSRARNWASRLDSCRMPSMSQNGDTIGSGETHRPAGRDELGVHGGRTTGWSTRRCATGSAGCTPPTASCARSTSPTSRRCSATGRWDEAGDAAGRRGARRWTAAGAELLVLCTNTMHKVADAVRGGGRRSRSSTSPTPPPTRCARAG